MDKSAAPKLENITIKYYKKNVRNTTADISRLKFIIKRQVTFLYLQILHATHKNVTFTDEL